MSSLLPTRIEIINVTRKNIDYGVCTRLGRMGAMKGMTNHNNKEHSMKAHINSIGISALILIVGLAQPGLAQERNSTAKERIGIYDSRAIAVAFAGSAQHEKELSQLKADHKKAKEAGDLAAVARFEAAGKARQAKAERQGFSTAPVDDILVHLTNALPEIQRTARVTTILSKWDETELKKHPQAEMVDVTMKLVDALQPNARQRKYAIEIQKQKPISLEEAAKIKH